MSIKPIIKLGIPQLKQASARVKSMNQTELQQLYQNMDDTQQHLNGVGIAAPQIGVYIQAILFGFDSCPRYPNEAPVEKTFLINPDLTPLSEKKELGWEGCLSVPGLRGVVERYSHIRYWGEDIHGNKIEREAKGFHARVVQHEIDHINGMLFIDRIYDNMYFGYEDVIDYTLPKNNSDH